MRSVSFPEVKKQSGDDWVKSREKPPVRRLTIDLPAEMHRRIKKRCISMDQTMSDVIRDILSKEFPPE